MRGHPETLESRCLLSVTPFSSPLDIVSSEIESPQAVEVADLDGDGLNDLFLSTYGGIQWIRQTATGFDASRESIGPSAGQLGDLNGDGAIDIVSVGFYGVDSYLNDGQGNFQQIAWSHGLVFAGGDSSLSLVDLDQDGDLDAAFIARDFEAEFTGLGWAVNDGQGNFGEFQPLIPLEDPFRGKYGDAAIADVDGDGDLDVATIDRDGSFFVNRAVRWHENIGDGYVARQVQIPVELDLDASLALADATGDGQLNLIVTTAARRSTDVPSVIVLKHDANDRNFVPLAEFGLGANATQLEFADIDLDGDLDVVRARGAQLEWFARDANGQFAASGVLITALDDDIDGFTIGDVDRDGAPDVVLVSSAFDFVAHYRNNGTGTFTEQPITVSTLNEVKQVLAADFDGDQKVDLITRGRHLSWLPATDGAGHFAPPRDLVDREMESVRLQDFDGDGDLDIAASDEVNLYLLINDGSGGVETQSLGDGGNAILDLDWDGDGDLDLITSGTRYSDDGAVLWWYENEGQGAFSPRQLLADLNHHPIFFDFGDDDFLWDRLIESLQPVNVKDSRMQVGVLVQQYSVDMWGVLLVGADEQGTTVVSPSVVRIDQDDTWMQFAAADTDGDGFDEIISLIDGDDWSRRDWLEVTADAVIERPFEQLAASIDTEQLRNIDYVAERSVWLSLATNQIPYDLLQRFYRDRVYPSSSLEFADLNGDGQLDIAAARDADLYWIENLTQQRDWNNDQGVDARDVDLLAAAMQADAGNLEFDVDKDQIVDHQDLETLVRSELNSHLADINLDGVFDSSDLVLLFQAGKYEADQVAVWSEGDFNSDGLFDSSDLVLALTFGYDDGSDDDD